MKSPALYILEVLFCSGMLLAFYRLLLMRKVSFAACRLYLVAAVVLSVVLPALNIPLYPARTVVYELPVIKAAPTTYVEEPRFMDEISYDFSTQAVTEVAAAPAVDWKAVARVSAIGLYLLTVAVSLGIFVVQIVRIGRLRRRSRLTAGADYDIAENPRVATPFSFLRTIFMGEGYEGRRRDIVVCHESSHVRHRHSLERIAVELVRCVFWFNPFVWIAGRWLSEAQEWEADHDVLNEGYDLTEYRTLIFQQLFGYNPDIACGLNHSLTKNRFAMMTKSIGRRYALLRLGAAIPLVAGIMLLCSFTTRTPDEKVSRIHISADGIEFNGEPISQDQLTDYVAAEREKAAAEGQSLVVQLTADNNVKMQGRFPLPEPPTTAYGKFGAKAHLHPQLGTIPFHRGVDMRANEGTPIYAAFDGEVKVSEYQKNGHGNYIEVAHVNGLTTGYAHLATLKSKVGDRVSAGDVIGTVGNTGRSTGPHLHFEIRLNGMPVNPELFFDFKSGKYLDPDPADVRKTDLGGKGNVDVLASDRSYLLDDGSMAYAGNVKAIHHNNIANPNIDMELRCDSMVVRPAEPNVECFHVTLSEGGSIYSGDNMLFYLGKSKTGGEEGWFWKMRHVSGTTQVKLWDKPEYRKTDFGAPGSIEVRNADRVWILNDGGRKIYAGNVKAAFQDKTAEPWLKAADAEIVCDSLVVSIEEKDIKCFNTKIKTATRHFVGDSFNMTVNYRGTWNWAMANTIGTDKDAAIIQITADGSIKLNGEQVALADLKTKLVAWRGDRKPSDLTASIYGDKETKMGIVTDVKTALREAQMLRIRYSGPGFPVERMMPPVLTEKDGKVVYDGNKKMQVVVEEIIVVRNTFDVLVNGSGQIMSGQNRTAKNASLKPASLEELTGQVKAFVLNEANDERLPEKRVKEFVLPDGGTMSYPVSEGTVRIQTMRETSYDQYAKVQKAITAAFDEIREELSYKQFTKSYNALSDAERQVVMQAVPIKVSEAEPRSIPKR